MSGTSAAISSRVEQLRVVDAELVLEGDAALVVGEVLLGVGGAQVAVAGDAQAVVALELGEDPHREHADLDRQRVDVLRLDDPDREPGGGAGDAAAVDHGDVATPSSASSRAVHRPSAPAPTTTILTLRTGAVSRPRRTPVISGTRRIASSVPAT